MARCMCGIFSKDGSVFGRISNEQVRSELGFESISEVMIKDILRLFGHVGWMEKEAWVKRSMCMNVVGRVSRSKPKWTWDAALQNDFMAKGVSRNTALDHVVKGISFTPVCMRVYWMDKGSQSMQESVLH